MPETDGPRTFKKLRTRMRTTGCRSFQPGRGDSRLALEGRVLLLEPHYIGWKPLWAGCGAVDQVKLEDRGESITWLH